MIVTLRRCVALHPRRFIDDAIGIVLIANLPSPTKTIICARTVGGVFLSASHLLTACRRYAINRYNDISDDNGILSWLLIPLFGTD